jgi:hypothetical protein
MRLRRIQHSGTHCVAFFGTQGRQGIRHPRSIYDRRTQLTVHMKAAKRQYHGHGLLRLQSFRITMYNRPVHFIKKALRKCFPERANFRR